MLKLDLIGFLSTYKTGGKCMASHFTIEGLLQATMVADRLQSRLAELNDRVSCSGGKLFLYGETGVGKRYVAEELVRHLGLDIQSITWQNARHANQPVMSHKTLYVDGLSNVNCEDQRRLYDTLVQDDVRIIMTDEKSLDQLHLLGQLYAPLYHYLKPFQAELPPLRQRQIEIPYLAAFFLTKSAQAHNRSIHSIDESVLEDLVARHWEGNCTELAAVCDRAVIVAKGPIIVPADIVLERRKDRIWEMPLKDLILRNDLEVIKTFSMKLKLTYAKSLFPNNREKVAHYLNISQRAVIQLESDLDAVTLPVELETMVV